MTELRVSHNDQMLVFQGIDASTCLQTVVSKPKMKTTNSTKIRNLNKSQLCNYPLHIVIHKSLANRAQTATGFLGQKYDPIRQNDFISNGVLVGQNIFGDKTKFSTNETFLKENSDFKKYNKNTSNRGKSAFVFQFNSKSYSNLSDESFVIKPVFKMECESKPLLYLSKQKSMLNVIAMQSTYPVDFNDYYLANCHSYTDKIINHKSEDIFNQGLSPTILSFQNSDKDKSSYKRKQTARMPFYNNTLLPLLWSEDLKASALFGYTKGRSPFQAVLAAQRPGPN